MSRFITAETSMGIETACDDETMLTAALIDVGGTLWPDRPPPSAKDLYVARLQEDFNLTTEEADRLLGELDRRNPARLWPPSLTQDGVAMATKALEAARLERINAAALLTTMDIPAFGVIDLFPGVKTLLQDIRQLGLRSVIFSNATFRTAAAYRRDFRAFSIGDLVDDVISSADIGYRKPHKEMFVAAVNAGETSPPKCVVLGDSEEKDIAPAKALGMKTVRVCIEQAPPAASEADVVVSSLEDAASAVATWVH